MAAILLLGATILSVLTFAAPAEASYHWHYKHITPHKKIIQHKLHSRWSRHVHRHYRRISRRHFVANQNDLKRDFVQQDCMVTARAQGGPCGCFAEHGFFETTARLWHGWNLWLADEWARAFPRVEAAPNTAAIWPGRHVAKVLDVKGKLVKVHDSWKIHWVSRSGLVFVQPPIKRPDLIRYAWAVPL